MLPSVMRWNKSDNAERQALVSAAMGQPGEDAGDVLDHFIRDLGLPRSLQDVRIGPEQFDRIAAAGDGDAMDPAQPAQDRRSGAGARNSGSGRIRTSGGTMYTGKHAHLRPLQPAFIMAGTGETVTYAELEARSNRLAHLLRNRGLKRLDHYAIFMENNSRYLEACGAGETSRTVLHLRQFLPDAEANSPTSSPTANRASSSRPSQSSTLRARRSRNAPKSNSASWSMVRAKASASSACSRRPLVCPEPRSRTNTSAPPCFIRRAPPAVRRASCGRLPNSRR